MKSTSIQPHENGITRTITAWGRRNFRPYPWRTCNNLWLSTVAEIMLQRTRVTAVLPVWNAFSLKYPSPESVMNDDYETFQLMLAPLGLRWRSQLLYDLSLRFPPDGVLPRDYESLRTFPGIGDYVASAISSLYMNQRAAIIDSNVVRWLSRMIGEQYDGETRRKRWLKIAADRLTPVTVFRDYNFGVLDFTMTICTTRPLCNECPVSKHCNYHQAQLNRIVGDPEHYSRSESNN